MNAFDMPTAPNGKVWKVEKEEWWERFDWFPYPTARVLTVALVDRWGGGSIYSFTPKAYAANNAGSVRRAAERVLAREAREERRRIRREESGSTARRKAREAARSEEWRLARERREAVIQRKYGELLGQYPPKRLGGRHD